MDQPIPPTPAPARAKTRIGEANVERILDAALAVFAQHGRTGARLDQIAAAAGLSKTNLLYYFRTKDELYTAVLTRTLEMWLEPLRALDAAEDPATALATYIAAKLDYSRDHPLASRLFAIEIMQGAPLLGPILATDLKDLVERKVAAIHRWIAQGRLAPVEPYHLIFMLWATTQHYADFASQIETLTGRSLEDAAFHAEARQAVTTTILQGLLPRG